MAIAELEIEDFVLAALADDDRMVRDRRRSSLFVRRRRRSRLTFGLDRRFRYDCQCSRRMLAVSAERELTCTPAGSARQRFFAGSSRSLHGILMKLT